MKPYEYYLTINQHDKIMVYLVLSWKIIHSMVKTSIELKRKEILKFQLQSYSMTELNLYCVFNFNNNC